MPPDLDSETSRCHITLMAEPEALELGELCEKAEVTQRTVRYYIQQGLLPAPVQAGPATRYGKGHLDRLRLIRLWQTRYLPLAVIRQKLASLDDGEVSAHLRRETVEARKGARPAMSPGEAALEYLKSLSGDRRNLPPAGRSSWERIDLTPDIQLHVRRPQTREQNRRIERLVEEALKLLTEP